MTRLLLLLLVTTPLLGVDIHLRAPGDTPAAQLAYARQHCARALLDAGNSLTVEKADTGSLPPESYRLAYENGDLVITAANGRAAINAMLDLSDKLDAGGDLGQLEPGTVAPRFMYRAIKYNLPWAAYRTGPSIEQHQATCRDLNYWRAFLDMMVENRFNTLSLWSLHPWHLMVRTPEYPEMSDLSDAELADWKEFWHGLFGLARERGIDTYLVNWNMFVSPAFSRAHDDAAGWSQTWGHFGSGPQTEGELGLVTDYTRATIREVLTEYPELTGLGITLGERMGGMSPDERRDWLEESIFAGIRDAARPVKFLYRAPLSASHGSGGTTDRGNDLATRRQVESLGEPFDGPIFVEFKFNWSHGHSSPGLYLVHGGTLSDAYFEPSPDKFKAVWTVRNEDFHQLRWGQPDFIREFIRRNGQDHTGGAIIGSEVFIPALDTLTREEHADHENWQFRRQWLWYMCWGRLLYDDSTTDSFFARQFEQRFPGVDGMKLLEAWKLASSVPLHFASFHQGRIDGSLYTEAFGQWRDRGKGIQLFDIHRFSNHPVLDPHYLNVRDYVRGDSTGQEGKITPPDLARILEANALAADVLLKSLREAADDNDALLMELSDIESWGHYARYFAKKLRAAVALERYRVEEDPELKAESVRHLESALRHWKDYARTTARYNNPEFLFHTDQPMSLTGMIRQAERDIKLVNSPWPDGGGWEIVDTDGKPHPRHEATFVESEGKLYLLGGRRIQPVDAYDPATNSWSQLAAPPLELHHFQALERNGEIWVIGAMTGPFPNETPVPNVYIFNPARNEWRKGPEIPEERRRGGGGVVEHDGLIYLVGGIQRGHMGGFVSWLDRWDPRSGEWEILPDAPHARDHFQAVVIDGKIYAAGGRQTSRETGAVFSNTVAEVDAYDLVSGKWSTLEDPLPTPRAGTSSMALDGCLLVAGGEADTRNRAFREVEAYDTRQGFWYDWPGLRTGRHGTALAIIDGLIYTCSGSGNRGGSPELDTLERITYETPEQ